MSNLIDALKKEANVKFTENGGVALSSTCDKLYDLFALGGAYRSRSEDDCILLFKEAYQESPTLALKCLFYNRDALQGQGERRFFRTCLHWLALEDPDAVRRNLNMLTTDMCRWDDIYCLMDTPVETDVFEMLRKQLVKDLNSDDEVSLAAKWCPSENASSKETKRLAKKTMKALGISARSYRRILSTLREKIRIVERKMSENKWQEIEYNKLPSRAGILYREAFQRHDNDRYTTFAQSKTTKVNAKTLYPYDVVREALKVMGGYGTRAIDDPQRLMVNKYWLNLQDYFQGAALDALVVCDTSASMTWTGHNQIQPIHVAVSLAMYAAERNHGPFANHYISFSRNARLVEVKGVDFCDKVKRIVDSNVCDDTNLESVFDLLIKTIDLYNLKPEDVPKSLIICSDMEVNSCERNVRNRGIQLTMEQIRDKWKSFFGTAYPFPHLIYWNCNSRNSTILDDPSADVTFVSGASANLFEEIIKGKTGKELMMEKLNSPRYEGIH